MRKFRQCDGSGWLALGVDGRIVPKPTPTDTERLAAVHELIEVLIDLVYCVRQVAYIEEQDAYIRACALLDRIGGKGE